MVENKQRWEKKKKVKKRRQAGGGGADPFFVRCTAGNVACDGEGGGRLIFYDFGMMDEFKPSVRSGLVNLIFSTYENDPRACCNALVEMGILKASADRIRWERLFFSSFFSGGSVELVQWF